MSDFFSLLDFIGTFVFAITGASIAAKMRFDFFGMLFLAFLTAVGGGTVRDIIIDSPVFWTQDPNHLYLIFSATVATFFLLRFIEKQHRFLLILDTLGVATFVAFGTHKTLLKGYNIETALIMGTISAVLGGILRSAFSSEHSILSNREFYATLAASASLVFILTNITLGLSENICASITIVFTFMMRYLVIKYRLLIPTSKV